jgi:hypothetical protein
MPEQHNRTRQDWSRDMKRGDAYEDWVYRMLQKHRGLTTTRYKSVVWQSREGENAAGIEIKLNEDYDKYGNLWIEFYRKSTSAQVEYTPSSLVKDTDTWLFVTGSYRRIFAFSAKKLRTWNNDSWTFENNTHTSIGGLLKGGQCEAEAEFVIDIPDKDIPNYVQ